MLAAAAVAERARPRPFAVLRARQWLHFLALPAAGASAFDSPSPSPSVTRLAAAVAIAALALGYAYGLNAISDRATDLDARKNPIAGAAACPQRVVALVCLAGVSALIAAAFLAVLPLALASIAAATVYSVGPRLKRWPIVGTLLNAGIFAPLLFLACDGGSPPAALALDSLAFLALLLQNQLLHEQADADEDAVARVVSTGRWLGHARTRSLVIAIGAAGACAAPLVAGSRLLGAVAVLALAGGTLAGAARGPAAGRRVAHRFVALAGGAALYAAGLLS